MTERVDFYVLTSAAPTQRWAFACRLTEIAYLRDMRVDIAAETAADAAALDDLLWTFNDNSFIPHQMALDAQSRDPGTKVHVTFDRGEAPGADLLVNLTAGLPAHWQRYTRIAEVIDADEERRRLGRERFKSYRDLKIELQTHG